MKDSACLNMDSDLFFPEQGKNAAAPLRICARCTVREACLDYALRYGERYGVWGGTTENERKRIRRRRAA